MDDAYVKQLFGRADSNGDGRLSGQEAVDFFRRSLLSLDLLSRLWSVTDSKNKGYLNIKQFRSFLYGIAWIQNANVIPNDAELRRMCERRPPSVAHFHGVRLAPRRAAAPSAASGTTTTSTTTSTTTTTTVAAKKSSKSHANEHESVQNLGALALKQRLHQQHKHDTERATMASTPSAQHAASSAAKHAHAHSHAAVPAHIVERASLLFDSLAKDSNGCVTRATVQTLWDKTLLPSTMQDEIWAHCDTLKCGALNRREFTQLHFESSQALLGKALDATIVHRVREYLATIVP